MSAAASWQKQLVYEFKELEGLQDAALLEDSQGCLQQAGHGACRGRCCAPKAAAAGAAPADPAAGTDQQDAVLRPR